MGEKKKHIPIRMCRVCRKRAPKQSLLRFTQALGELSPIADLSQIAPGRGVYLCTEAHCQEVFYRRSAKRKGKGRDV